MTHAKQMTRKVTWDMFQYQQKLRVSGIKALERIKRDQVKDEYKVQQEILNDKMFTKFKVEIKTYNEALIVH
jgi:hypothetical protein